MKGQFAVIFPGQGVQQVGMLSSYADDSLFRTTIEEASSVLGFDVQAMINEGPAEALNKTENTQPVLLAVSVALWRVWRDRGGDLPVFMAGHSLGEYSALVCAEAMDFSSAITLVKHRGQYMQSAVAENDGKMAAILGLDDNVVDEVCQKTIRDLQGKVVEAVNFNAPGQVVIAGHADAVLYAVEQAKEKGAKKAIPLPVGVPSHCKLMKPAAEKLEKSLEGITIKVPVVPIMQNVSAQANSDPHQLKQNLVLQLYHPVRWVESVKNMCESGVERFVECGPGKVLSGLSRRIVRRVPIVALESANAMDDLLNEQVATI
ncbi:Malonyl CoA-acyl carrier protein transacylase [invertebrate metagenome]|uniref:[acyl-carrier-protein] S-malonyltransferase n=1 Tax=invertebrate metagenome TaxID=1711999 RepID=A0A2H9T9M4_9ZZZZ